MIENIKFEFHFSNIGWITERSNYSVVLFPEERMEAFRIKSDTVGICYACVNSDAKLQAESGEIAGTTGRGRALYGICAKCAGEMRIWYRIFSAKNGWSNFKSEGEWVFADDGEQKKIPISGVQFFTCAENERMEDCFKRAEEELEKYSRLEAGLFVRDKRKLFLSLTQNYRIERTDSVTVEEGFILPLKSADQNSRNGVFQGGVADRDFHFVAGQDRDHMRSMNLSCVGSYQAAEWEESSETVIFGGIFHSFWGHFITECLARLWWVIEHPDASCPIVILTYPNAEVQKQLNQVLELLHIDAGRIRLIRRPVRFRKIIVPEQSVRLFDSFTDKFTLIYDTMRENVTAGSYEKIYLTRSGLPDSDCVNEEFLENFYSRRGYKVISPEKYSLRIQISFLAGASDVVCTEGTLSHMLLFCNSGTRVTIFRRCEDKLLKPQYIINQARGLNVTYVDATYNFLPVQHAGGVFLFGPTEHFREYLAGREIVYDEKELDFNIGDFTHHYIDLWLKRYNRLKNFQDIRSVDMFEIIDRMNRVFGYPALDPEKYITKQKELEEQLYSQKVQLRTETESLQEELRKARKEAEKKSEELKKERKRWSELQNAFQQKALRQTQEIEQLQTQLQDICNQYEQVLNSKSWRYTQALRNLIWKTKK